MLKKSGALTSGGDSSGMTAAVRAVVRSGIANGMDFFKILSQVFGLAKAQSNEAQQLTNAVCLAQNAAEAAAASGGLLRFLRLKAFL